uniref:Uncharacterized protein n=1 Tax=Amphimedon queenslandica TaxID=400682 RepID=A0A1X7UQK6_AMPQE
MVVLLVHTAIYSVTGEERIKCCSGALFHHPALTVTPGTSSTSCLNGSGHSHVRTVYNNLPEEQQMKFNKRPVKFVLQDEMDNWNDGKPTKMSDETVYDQSVSQR